MTNSKRLSPRWLIEEGKHAATFSELAYKCFLQIKNPLRSESGRENMLLLGAIRYSADASEMDDTRKALSSQDTVLAVAPR